MEQTETHDTQPTTERNNERARDLATLAPQTAAALIAAQDSPQPRFDFERALASFANITEAQGVTEHAQALLASLRAASERCARIRQGARGKPGTAAKLDDDMLALSIVLLAAGMMPVDVAAIIGCHVSTLYRYRRLDRDYGAAWESALDAGLGMPILARMASIAMTGDPAHSTTVRAAELVLRRVDPVYRAGALPGAARIEARRKGPDGAEQRVIVELGTPIPD